MKLFCPDWYVFHLAHRAVCGVDSIEVLPPISPAGGRGVTGSLLFVLLSGGRRIAKRLHGRPVRTVREV